ncbi:MAG: hypothetical protein H6807_13995 [Planctomycetes bacterium]|nr:hypothetical protein [Planctomycetota bacterium]
MYSNDTVKKAIPTSRHAELLFDLVLDYLQEGAFVVSADQGSDRTIYLRDETGSWIAPWPLLKLTLGRRGSFVGIPGELSNEVPGESGAAPSRLKNLQGGEIEIYGAEGRFAITYASDGQACETSRSGDETVAALARALDVGGGNPVDLLALFIASRNAPAEAPGRVRLTEGAAVGLMMAWRTGLAAMRRALFFTSASKQGTWIAADGYAGTAIGTGATRKEAVEACREQVRLLGPVPPEPRRQPELSAEVLAEMGFGDAQLISTPAEDRERGAATIENTPIVMTSVPAVSEMGGRSVVLLDEKGRGYGASVFEREGGLTIIEHGVIDQVDLEGLEEQIEAAIVEWNERRGPEPSWPEGLPPLRSKSWMLDVGPGGELRVCGSSATPEFDPGALDGAQLHERGLRQVAT